jgi:hypothetical protein
VRKQRASDVRAGNYGLKTALSIHATEQGSPDHIVFIIKYVYGIILPLLFRPEIYLFARVSVETVGPRVSNPGNSRNDILKTQVPGGRMTGLYSR